MEKEIFGFVISNTPVGRFTHKIPPYTLVTVLPDPIHTEFVARCSSKKHGQWNVLLEDLVILHRAENISEAEAYANLIRASYDVLSYPEFEDFCKTIGTGTEETVEETQKSPYATALDMTGFGTDIQLQNVTSYYVSFYNGTLSIKVKKHA